MEYVHLCLRNERVDDYSTQAEWLLSISYRVWLIGLKYPLPVHTRCLTNFVLKLGQRRRRWPDINRVLVECLAFTEATRLYELPRLRRQITNSVTELSL